MNEHQDLTAAEESERLFLRGRYIIGRFSCILKFDTYHVCHFMALARSKERSAFSSLSRIQFDDSEIMNC
jgi:hypothetical protein